MAPAISSAARRRPSIAETSQIRTAQFRLTHLYISEIASPENTAAKVCTIKIRVFEIAAVEFRVLKYRKTALRVYRWSPPDKRKLLPFRFAQPQTRHPAPGKLHSDLSHRMDLHIGQIAVYEPNVRQPGCLEDRIWSTTPCRTDDVRRKLLIKGACNLMPRARLSLNCTFGFANN